MSMRDKQWLFSEDQTMIIAHTTPTSCTNPADLTGGNSDKNGFDVDISPNLSAGGILRVVFILSTAYVGNAAGFTASLYTHTTNALASGTKLASVLIPNGAAIGKTYELMVPADGLLRWFGPVYEAITGNGTAGAISSWLDITQQTEV